MSGSGLARLLLVLAVAAVATLALLLVFDIGLFRGDVARGPYVARNRALLDALPVYPLATVSDEVTTAYKDGESVFSPVVGYSTRREYRLVRPVPAARLLRFFAERRRGWSLYEQLGGVVDNYRRGGATLSVNAENAPYAGYELAVDAGSQPGRR